MGTQVPYIFNEKPELLEEFDGFTYYPNTISYGSYTRFGSSALYGGYEYTPERMNERSSESIASKHDEALKVMPVIFGDDGFEVTICNPSLAGFEALPDLSIYDEYPEFKCFNTYGHFSVFSDDLYVKSSVDMSARIHDIRNRNFFCFSVMKISPVILQETLYDGGLYNESYSGTDKGEDLVGSSLVQRCDGLSCSTGYCLDFIESYTVLSSLPEITDIDDSANNTFLVMVNDATHSKCLLQEPDYIPANRVDNTAYDVDMVSRYTVDGKTMQMETEDQITHYHVNISTYIQLGKWFDYLRENGVYDNTRIILVSDHGKDLGQFDITCNGDDMEIFMSLLMVKDFDAKGFTVCEDFMTNADTPIIATSGLIENPVNPFTGKPISSDEKIGPYNVIRSELFQPKYNKGNIYPAGSWYAFNGNDVYDPDNWTYLGYY